MSKLAVPSGVALGDARRRINGRGFWSPSLSAAGVDATTSTRATATCTASATPHTKGTWTQVVAATTVEATLLSIGVSGAAFSTGINASNTDTSTLLDIGIGGAGAEVALVANLGVGFSLPAARFRIPVLVPVGSRLSIRAQSVVVSQQVTVGIELGVLPFGKGAPNHLVTMGADTAASKGVGLAVPGAANTKGAWTEIVAASSEPFDALVIGQQCNADAAAVAGGVLFDIGIGSAGNEVVRLGDLAYQMSGTEICHRYFDPLQPLDIPAGTRIAARYQAGNTGNSVDLVLIGVPRQ